MLIGMYWCIRPLLFSFVRCPPPVLEPQWGDLVDGSGPTMMVREELGTE